MSREETGLSDRQILLTRLLDAVKQCQIRFGGRTELATESDSSVVNLCTQYEAVLQHGMKKSNKGLATIRQVTEIVKGLNLWNGDSEPEELVFWHFIRTHLTRHELERYHVLKNVSTDEGRGRAWLRSALNEHSLERYMHMMLADPAHIAQFYEEWAFVMDQERSSMLPTMSAGLGSILFAINIDNPDLNPLDLLSGRAPQQSLLTEPEPVIVSSASTKKKKKKKRPRSQVVSFDDDDIGDTLDDRSPELPYSCYSAPPTCLSSPVSGQFPDLVDKVSDIPGVNVVKIERITQQDGTQSVESLSQSGIPEGDSPSMEKCKYETEFSEVPDQSTDSEDKTKQTLPKSLPDKSQMFKRKSTKPLDPISCSPARDSEAFQPVSVLTPVLDTSIGELIPLTHGDDIPSSEDSLSIPSYSEDTDSAAAALMLAQNVATWASASPSSAPSLMHYLGMERKLSDLQTRSETLTMTPEELKEALIAMMQRKEDIEEKNNALRNLLDREMEISSGLRVELEEVKKQFTERMDKQDIKIQTLSRENELLKHQLKKYVAAVQLLKRDGLTAHETLSRMIGDVQPAIPDQKTFVDHQYEASEYEKKLVQVAEMHGELMEFNERLHRMLLYRETTIRRLREELTDLRGPLPDEIQTSDDDISVTSDYDASSQTAASRPLINIWIPSAFLAGHHSDAFHVYQVYIRIRDDEWNVYRRYSQFYTLHKMLKKKNPVVNTFDFPPKKSIGNKEAKIVEERRKRLQHYLRCVLNWLMQTNTDLLSNPEKETLVTLLPFFREQDSAHSRARLSTHSQNRLRIPSTAAGAACYSGSPAQHYMGL